MCQSSNPDGVTQKSQPNCCYLVLHFLITMNFLRAEDPVLLLLLPPSLPTRHAHHISWALAIARAEVGTSTYIITSCNLCYNLKGLVQGHLSPNWKNPYPNLFPNHHTESRNDSLGTGAKSLDGGLSSCTYYQPYPLSQSLRHLGLLLLF